MEQKVRLLKLYANSWKSCKQEERQFKSKASKLGKIAVI